MSGGFILYILSMKLDLVRAFLFLSLLVLGGCAGSKSGEVVEEKNALGATECPGEASLYGQGLAGTQQTALMLAQKKILSSIDSLLNVSGTAELYVDQEMQKASLAAKSQFLSRLENPENVGIDTVEENAGKFMVRACMAKANAAVPFRKKYVALRDSVELRAGEISTGKDIFAKKESYTELRKVYARLIALYRIMGVLGDSVALPDTLFTKANRVFNTERQGYAFVFTKVARESDSPASDALYTLALTRIAKDYPVRQSGCDKGLNMDLDIYPVVCDSANFGTVCSANIALKASLCGGDSLFVLKASVSAQDAQGEAAAMERLSQMVSEGVWFEDWRKDLNKWSLK